MKIISYILTVLLFVSSAYSYGTGVQTMTHYESKNAMALEIKTMEFSSLDRVIQVRSNLGNRITCDNKKCYIGNVDFNSKYKPKYNVKEIEQLSFNTGFGVK